MGFTSGFRYVRDLRWMKLGSRSTLEKCLWRLSFKVGFFLIIASGTIISDFL
jgi:hypothetical protein